MFSTIPKGAAHNAVGNPNPAATSDPLTYFIPPTVTIARADNQTDPAGIGPINFTVVFNEPVIGFDDPTHDVVLSGTAGSHDRQDNLGG